MKLILYFTFLGLISAFSLSCVSLKKHTPPKDWPKTISEPELIEFEGSFSNSASSATNSYGEPNLKAPSLSHFLSGDDLHSTPRISLNYKQNHLLVRKPNDQTLIAKVPVSPTTIQNPLFIRQSKSTTSDALSSSYDTDSFYLYVAEDGSLIGQKKGSSIGRSLFFPAYGTGSSWTRWSRN